MTKAKTIRRNILPGGYILMKSMVDHPEWPVGYYGLVQCNDPDFVWKEKPLRDPTIGKNLDKDEKAYKASNKYIREIASMEKSFLNTNPRGRDLRTYYLFYKACLRAGYRPHRDGYRVIY